MPKLYDLKLSLKSKALDIRALKEKTKKTQRSGGIAGDMQYQLLKDRLDFRLRHIAYCLLRGRKYEEIEKPREPLPEHLWKTIEKVRRAYAPEDVCANAA